MICVVLALALPSISLQHVLSAEDEVAIDRVAKTFRDTDKVAHDAIDLLANVFIQVKKYECARKQEDCKAWEAWNLGDALVLKNVNCDETPDNEMCRKARDLLHMTERKSHRDIINGLADVGEGVPLADLEKIRDMEDAVVNYICYNYICYREMQPGSVSDSCFLLN